MRDALIGDAKMSYGDEYKPQPIIDVPNQGQSPMGRPRRGSPIFYAILDDMAATHDIKSHDYASDKDPFGNYHFAGMLGKMFNNPDDSGFVARLGEKLFRLANLDNNQLVPKNESVEDTERDLCVIMTLWVADRRTRRMKQTATQRIGTEMLRKKVELDPRD